MAAMPHKRMACPSISSDLPLVTALADPVMASPTARPPPIAGLARKHRHEHDEWLSMFDGSEPS